VKIESTQHNATMEDDGGEGSSFLVSIIENRAKEVSIFNSQFNLLHRLLFKSIWFL